ncbi:MAG: RidA family protein [Hyphomicrobiaceae bacterium]|nr:RidA family protein [Hyphomicrobiaceae bacterium]MCC0006974.1 RidA family protein [Hyphomicrobiaceae bacterium]
MSQTIAARLQSLGLSLPEAPAPVANYVPYLISGELLFVSGQISKAPDGSIVKGRLGDGLSVAEGQTAARYCALNILAQANAALGSLDRIAQVMRLTGFVTSAPDCGDQPAVVNGASDLMVEVLGEAGRHTRVAVGVAALPAGCAVEIDAIIRIKP